MYVFAIARECDEVPQASLPCGRGSACTLTCILMNLSLRSMRANSDIVLLMLSRRTALLAPLAAAAATSGVAATTKMTLCMHQGTSRAAGFRKSLEGWAKAGIKNVELSDTTLDDFLKTDTLDAAGRL